MSRRGVLVAALWLVLATGCAHAPFPRADPVATDPSVGAAELAAAHWPPRGEVYRVRQTAVLELRGSRMPMTGLVQLDTREGHLRLVALNDLGVKLLDVSVSGAEVYAHYVLPGLERQPGLVKVVAESARRVFLSPGPEPGDPLEVRRTSYRMERAGSGVTYAHTYAGSPPRLVETSAVGPAGEWVARFYEYRTVGDVAHPSGVVLTDAAAPYRLTIWLEEVKTLHE